MKWNDIPSWAYDTASVIMQTVRHKDPETYAHSVRVAQNSRLFAKAVGLNDYQQRVLEFSGLLHDVGKVGIPDAILLKPSKLTDHEFEIMKSHPQKSAEVIEPLTHNAFIRDLVPGVLHHHERIDGRGYPYGLAGDNIPLQARIILIVDTVDAMGQDRSYRKGMPMERILQELKEFSGRQFDEHLVRVYLESHTKWDKDQKQEVADEMQALILKAA